MSKVSKDPSLIGSFFSLEGDSSSFDNKKNKLDKVLFKKRFIISHNTLLCNYITSFIVYRYVKPTPVTLYMLFSYLNSYIDLSV